MLALRREAGLASPGAGQALASRFPDQWVPSAGVVVAGYWPLGREIDPRPLMQRLFAGGARLCLPVVEGARYYDYTLAALRASGPTLAIGLAYDCQMVSKLPAQGHDEPLDGLVTDTDVYDFRG